MLRHAFAGALFAAFVIGWFWLGTLGAVGAGWQPVAQRVAQALPR
jgi:hypothetical protein